MTGNSADAKMLTWQKFALMSEFALMNIKGNCEKKWRGKKKRIQKNPPSREGEIAWDRFAPRGR